MTNEMKAELQKLCGAVLFDEPLARYTTIRVGGPADAIVYPKTIEELSRLALFARHHKLPLFVLGAGSNLLVRDKGIRGIVVSLSQGFGQIRIEEVGAGFKPAPTVIVYAEAGVGIPRLVDWTADEGLTGLEPIAGIPGNLGGALAMNAGTPDGEIADAVETVAFIDKDGRLTTWEKEKIRFGYRESHFPKGAVILSARLKLARMASEIVRGRVQKYRAQRVETQPLNVPNLGSVFKNPREKKMFAGKLIEEAGLKDVRVGGARISPKHGNFIVNEGGATAKDVLALIGLARDKVKEKFGLLLEPEVKIVGEE
jgi:UDP-N-acetylmuramate dehydrogenase